MVYLSGIYSSILIVRILSKDVIFDGRHNLYSNLVFVVRVIDECSSVMNFQYLDWRTLEYYFHYILNLLQCFLRDCRYIDVHVTCFKISLQILIWLELQEVKYNQNTSVFLLLLENMLFET